MVNGGRTFNSHPADRLHQLAGAAGAAGGIVLAIAYLAYPADPGPALLTSRAWAAIHVGLMLAHLTSVFLLFALLTKYLRRGGDLAGALGCVLAIASLVFMFGLRYAQARVWPELAAEFPESWLAHEATATPFAALGLVAGLAVFAWRFMRTAAVAKSAVLATLLGALVFAMGQSAFAPLIVSRAGAVLLGGGFVMLGFSLLRNPR